MLDFDSKIWYNVNMDKSLPKRILPIALLAAYTLAVAYITLLSRDAAHASIELDPIASYHRATNAPRHLAILEIRSIILNIAMFVPLGLLLPMASVKFRKIHITLPVALLASLAIETAQLATHRGVFSIEDILHNTLGAALGLTFYHAASKIFKNP